MSVVEGKLLAVSVKVGSVFKKIRCQTAGTLTLTAGITDDAPCKPDDTTPPDQAGWITRTVDSRDWKISVSAQTFLDSIKLNGSDFTDMFIAGNLSIDVEFLTTPGQHTFAEDILYAGTGLIATITLNAPVSGASTYDLDISGNGPLTSTRIPVIT